MADAAGPGVSGARVLVADDHEPTLRVLTSLLQDGLAAEVRSTNEANTIGALAREFEPDLVMLRLQLAGLEQLDVIKQVRSGIETGEFLPIVMVSSDGTAQARERAAALGAHDFLRTPIDPIEAKPRLETLLRLRALTARLERDVQDRVRELRDAELDMASRLAAVAEMRDYPDGAHVQRVGQLSALIARQLGLDSTTVMLIRFAAPLHDIGKLALPDAVLLKPGQLSPAEQELVREHTTAGARLLGGSRSPILRLAEEIALHHHDHWDGTGYHEGLRGDNIPVAARIVAVADVFDALTHPRPYKPRWTIDEAMTWMESMRGRRFDPAVVDALFAILGDGGLPAGDDAVVGPAIVTAGANRDGMITSRVLPRIRGIYWPA